MEYLFFKYYSHREKYVQIFLVEFFLTCYSLLVHKIIQGQLKEVCFDLVIKGDKISKACYLASGSIPVFEWSVRACYCLIIKTLYFYCRKIHCSRGRQLLSIFFFLDLKQFCRYSDTMVFEKRRSDIADQ